MLFFGNKSISWAKKVVEVVEGLLEAYYTDKYKKMSKSEISISIGGWG